MSTSFKELRGFSTYAGLIARQRAAWIAHLSTVATRHGFGPVEMPIVDHRSVFEHAVGETSDIVQKEMFRAMGPAKDDGWVLRPEGTAQVMRSRAAQGDWSPERAYYCGPMFRYERPQKGRLRQFTQFGVECMREDVGDDIAILLLGEDLLRPIHGDYTLEINTLGSAECRSAFRDALVAYLTPMADQLSEDSRNRLVTNPLRILDSKVESDQSLLNNAPRPADYLSDEESARFAQVQAALTAANVEFVVNPSLVRGLDYYNGLVFEWTTDKLGAQAAIAAGGRYDSLAQMYGKQSVPAIGFAIGIERIAEIGQIENKIQPTIRVVVHPSVNEFPAQWFAEVSKIRDAGGIVEWDQSQRSFKAQMRRAGKDEIDFLIVLGEDEIRDGIATIKVAGGEPVKVRCGTQGEDISSLFNFVMDKYKK